MTTTGIGQGDTFAVLAGVDQESGEVTTMVRPVARLKRDTDGNTEKIIVRLHDNVEVDADEIAWQTLLIGEQFTDEQIEPILTWWLDDLQQQADEIRAGRPLTELEKLGLSLPDLESN